MRTDPSFTVARRLLFVVSLASSPAMAQLQSDVELDAPRVIRYVSSLPAHKGQTCYGLLLADDKGIPTVVRALSDQREQLCHEGDSPYSQARLMRWAFEAADAVASREQEQSVDGELSEVLEQERLAELVLPPVAITAEELGSLQRFVIGVGLNYAEHIDEVGIDRPETELLVFPKPVEPTGAYAPVRAGIQIGETPARPVLLLDYEVELGLVLLKDIDLHDPPRSYEAFIETVAFFVANDVSDREPIILDEETGYTRGKSRSTYLPTGPWMVHGRHLRPHTLDEGEHSLEIGLTVQEARPAEDLPFGEARQLSTTDAMLRGPWGIIRHLSDTLKRGTVICMRDAEDRHRYVHNADGVIPAGSIILTGTPGGTAIHEPRLLEKVELLLRGGFSLRGGKETFIEDAERNIAESPYLETGDRVESWVEYLGRQRWSVVSDAQLRPYGIDRSGGCEPERRPRPLARP